MITKKIILSLFFFTLFLTILNGVLAYTLQIPLCTPSINTNCINYTSVSPITNIPLNGIMFWKDGYLYLTNETAINYTVINNNYTYINNGTNITYYITNVTTYSYNLTNGSNLIIIQNITANESIVRDWVNSKFNTTFYNKSDAEITFAFKTELNELKNTLSSYAVKTDLDKYGYLLAINASGIDELNLNENDSLSMIWKVIIIINCILIVIIILFIIKSMMSP